MNEIIFIKCKLWCEIDFSGYGLLIRNSLKFHKPFKLGFESFNYDNIDNTDNYPSITTQVKLENRFSMAAVDACYGVGFVVLLR